ncbi:trimeric intracellular cation channel family protein [Actomonas aquatica]|uniref:TRIC cation channel family protein n=1 Tax=Actomonas aquatica TaxID=2866162 RepID=A0ABZ1C5V0_9BACT|nr:TRIC cation channel family protein [Opitutus sp. WL0086]WRQ85899.1 TRIC cation channel family protein [Opitutus sp. WL0086]
MPHPSLTNPFFLPIWFELAAVILLSMTAGIVAMKRGYDVVGVAALALLVGLGGGLIRDGIFIQQGPPGVVTNPLYIQGALLGAAVGALLGDRVERFRRVIAAVDALALGAYAAFGVQRALGSGLPIPAAILIGVVTAVGGGLLRDVITNEEPLVFRPGQFYALVALAASTLFVVLTVELAIRPTWSAGIVIVLTFVFRVLTIVFNWKTAPLAPPPQAPPSI